MWGLILGFLFWPLFFRLEERKHPKYTFKCFFYSILSSNENVFMYLFAFLFVVVAVQTSRESKIVKLYMQIRCTFLNLLLVSAILASLIFSN